MEILGRTIPGLQNAISSGLESVSAGIAETVKTSGVSALGIAQDSFSFEQMAIPTSADLPVVSGVAEYPRPDQYFRRFPGTASDSPVSSLAISQALSDPSFNAPKSLQTFSNSSGSMVDNALKYARALWESAANTPGVRLNQPLDRVEPDSIGDIWGAELTSERTAAVSGLGEQVSYPTGDRHGRENSNVASLNDPAYLATDRFGRDQIQGTSVQGKVISGYSDGSSDRSIIVVGGKTSDTNFQTIDDSLSQLQSSPTPETSNLFSQQLSAVTDMLSTVAQSVQLQQDLTLNRFTTLR